MKRTLKEKATSIILGLVTIVGGFLVAEGVFSGEQLTSIQNLTGMVLSGGGLTLATLLYTVRVLVPKNFLANLGEEKVTKFFQTLDALYDELQLLRDEVKAISEEFALARKEKEELLSSLKL
jgi:hypothetical protein